MKKDFNQSKLVDALLKDEAWESCSARVHDGALATLRVAKKSYARRLAAARAVAVVLLAVLCWRFNGRRDGWLGRNSVESINSSPESSNISQSEAASTSSTAHRVPYITEDQMLAMFPEGSCVLAEVDGQKQLIVLDDAAARNGIEPSQTQ